MFRFGQEEPEPEPEPEPINWSANLIIAAKGGSVVIPEIWDEWDTLVQEEEELAGLELAKRCRLEGANLAYTGAEPSSDDSIDVAEAETARTALDWASAFKNIEVMEYLQLEDATERLVGLVIRGRKLGPKRSTPHKKHTRPPPEDGRTPERDP